MEMKLIAPTYFKKFKCIGSECEANCCDHPWKIDVNKIHYEKIKSDFSEKGKEKLFDRVFKKQISNDSLIVTDATFGYIKQCSDGGCEFLNSDKLCGLVIDLGFEFLPDVCTTYPRISNGIEGDKIEANLSLSCPEAARNCILNDEEISWQHIDLIDMGSPRISPQIYLNGQTRNQYNKFADVVKSFAVNIMQDKDTNLKNKLFVLAFLGSKTKPFLYQGMNLDVNVKLQQILNLLGDSKTRKALKHQLSDFNLPTHLSMSILREILAIQGSIRRGGLLNGLFFLAEENFSKIATAEAPVKEISDESMWGFYSDRKERLNKKYGSIIEKRITNYIIHFWLTDWYPSSANILIHVRKCLTYRALVNYLFYCHTDINDMLLCKKSAKNITLIDKVLIEVIYSVTRDLNNSPLAMDIVGKQLDKKNIVELAPIMLLLDF